MITDGTQAPRIDMKIKIGIGVDNICFGLTENEALKLLGKPDKLYSTDCGCRRLQFNEKLIELSFEPENDYRVGWIEVHNPQAVLFKKMLIGLPEHDVALYLIDYLSEQSVVTDYGSFSSHEYKNEWLELQYEFGRLRSINLGVLYGGDDKPVWPFT